MGIEQKSSLDINNHNLFEVGALRIKDGRPQVLHALQLRKGELILTWYDYLDYHLSVNMTKTNDDYVTLKKLYTEELPKPETQTISVRL